MTRDESASVVEMILNSWPKPEWTLAQTETYVNALVPYDADYAVQAVALAHKELLFRPPFSELLAFYKRARADADAREYKPHVGNAHNKMPMWVREWVAARFLHARFGREQDMRRFPQMGDWGDPDLPLMPQGEWSREAAHITDRDAWSVIKL